MSAKKTSDSTLREIIKKARAREIKQAGGEKAYRRKIEELADKLEQEEHVNEKSVK